MAETAARPALTRAATALGIVIAVLVSLLPKLLSRGEAPRG